MVSFVVVVIVVVVVLPLCCVAVVLSLRCVVVGVIGVSSLSSLLHRHCCRCVFVVLSALLQTLLSLPLSLLSTVLSVLSLRCRCCETPTQATGRPSTERQHELDIHSARQTCFLCMLSKAPLSHEIKRSTDSHPPSLQSGLCLFHPKATSASRSPPRRPTTSTSTTATAAR